MTMDVRLKVASPAPVRMIPCCEHWSLVYFVGNGHQFNDTTLLRLHLNLHREDCSTMQNSEWNSRNCRPGTEGNSPVHQKTDVVDT